MLNEDGSSPTFHNLVSKEDTYTYNTLTPIAFKFCEPQFQKKLT